jgi:hypothetical protein
MADRYDWDKDRNRGRSEWERNREAGPERDWERERRMAGGENRQDWGRERDDYSARGDYGPQGTWGRYGDRPDFNRDYNWRSRGQEWGHESDRGRNEDWERHPEWGRNTEWGRNERNERYGGGTQTYGGNRDYNRERDYNRGMDWNRPRDESDFGGYNSSRTPLYGTGGGGFGTGFSSYGAGSFSGGMGSYSGGMGSYTERGRFAGRGPKSWQRSDDRIREDINERLTDHPQIDASEIEVQVKNGEVTLTGTVDERQAKRMAEDIAENVSGVKDVHNNIRVQHGSMQEQGSQTQQHSGTMASSGTGTSSKTK